MSLVIPDELLQTAHISAADLKLEIAILLFQQEKITLRTASQFAGIDRLKFQQILGDRKAFTSSNPQDFQQNLSYLEANRLATASSLPTQTEVLQRMEQQRTFEPAQHHLPATFTLLQEDRAR